MPVPDDSDREQGQTGPEPPAEAPKGSEAPEARRQPSLAGDLAEVERGRPERAFNLGLVLGIIVTVAGAIFVIQNNQSTQFDWLWFDFEVPLWTALLGATVFGALLIVVGFAVHERHQRRLGRRQDAAGRLRRALGPSGKPARRSPKRA
jgi:uncharacterized integral membrane protein